MAIDVTVRWKDVVKLNQMPLEIAQITDELLNDADKAMLAASFLTVVAESVGRPVDTADELLTNLKSTGNAINSEKEHTPVQGMLNIIGTIMFNTTVEHKDVRVEVDGKTLTYTVTVLEEEVPGPVTASNVLSNPVFNFPAANEK